jgi:uncharacterized protein (UPF0261 family)
MIVIIGTLDTKGDKVAYLKQLIEKSGSETLVIDSGVLDEPYFQADIPREKVAAAAGKSISEIISLHDEVKAMRIMARGVSRIVGELHSSGKLDGLLSLGGTMGTSLFLLVANTLPLGLPKVIFTTTAFSPFMRPELVPPDLLVIPAISDIWGINSLTKRMLDNAAGTIIGAARFYQQSESLTDRNFTAITTCGTSATKYIVWLKPTLEKLNHEVVAFHIGGGQGWTYEHLVSQGVIKGALDLCLMDIFPIDVTRRGFLNVRGRLEAAGKRNIPQVIAPSMLDTFGWASSLDTLPRRFKQRKKHQHSEMGWAIERSLEEVAHTAKIVANKLNQGGGPRVIVIPKRGFSGWDQPGEVFYDPERSRVFTQALTAQLSPEVKVVELDLHINDHEFADEVANIFISMVN